MSQVFARYEHEAIVIFTLEGRIRIEVAALERFLGRKEVKLAIDAPATVLVKREEMCDEPETHGGDTDPSSSVAAYD